ncbi:hypothetical protein [Paracoccus ravus]|uniref:hypothetical protein n=1 Tax=Paracoccus ravus TaxID=2447760 RepID=UPI00106DE21D|nr:hypothetical protein [Paracoccus ravus]
MSATVKSARVAQLVAWLKTEVGDRAVSGKALADILDAVLQAVAADREAEADALAVKVTDAAGAVIKEQVADLSDRLDRIDGAHLIKSAGGAVIAANLAALARVAEQIELRKAAIIRGEPSPFIRAVIGGERNAPRDENGGKQAAESGQIIRKLTVSP